MKTTTIQPPKRGQIRVDSLDVARSVLSRATAVWSARHYDADLDALIDLTKNGHDARFGSAVGADTNDPLRLLKDPAGRYVYHPGTTDNYLVVADVNLLDADTAHAHQSTGLWTSGVLSGLEALFGGNSIQVTGTSYTSTTYALIATGNTSIPVVAGQQYSFTCSAKPGTSPVRGISIVFYWYQADGTASAVSSYSSVGYVTAESDDWFERTITATAPSDAAFVKLQPRVQSLGEGETYYFDRFCLRLGANTTFVPSKRIVGDIEITGHLAAEDWIPPAGVRHEVIGSWSGSTADQRSYLLELSDGGQLRLFWSTAGTDTLSAEATVAMPTPDGEDIHVRAVLLTDNGAGVWEIRFYTSPDGVVWEQLGNAVTGAGTTSIFPGSNPLRALGNAAGFYWHGRAFSVEVRDGEDGPVVASFDARDLREPYTTYTDPQGNVWTLNRSASGRKLAVVDRDLLLFGTDDYLEVPDHPDLNFGAGNATVIALFRAHHAQSGDTSILQKHPGGSNVGWRLYLNGSGKTGGAWTSPPAAAVFEPGGSFSGIDSKLHSIASKRETGTVTGYNDGVVDSTPSTFTESVSNTSAVHIGRNGASYADMEFIGAAIFRGEALSEADLREAVAELKAA